MYVTQKWEWDLSKSSILNFTTKESQFTSFILTLQVFLLWLPALMTWILDSFKLLSSFLLIGFMSTLPSYPCLSLLMMILLLPWFTHIYCFWLWLLSHFTVTIGHTFHFSTQRHRFNSSFPFTEHFQHPCLHTTTEVGIPMLRSSASDTCFI